jgi:hypothetical protein
VGEGASLAHYILGENGSEYLAKGTIYNSTLPYVASNEYICAHIASALSLPVLDFRIIEFGKDLLFGSSYIEKGRQFYPGITEDLFNQCANKGRCYDVVAFDILVYNTDRHQGNLLVRTIGPRGSDELLFLNDHSHALVQAGKTPADMGGLRDRHPGVAIDFVRNAITSRSSLDQAVSLIEGSGEAIVKEALRSVPEGFLAGNDVNLVQEFLLYRCSNLRAIINSALHVFPQLRGQGI